MTGRTFAIGDDFTINRLGYGAMRLTGQLSNFGPFPAWDQGVALLRRAADLGITFFDARPTSSSSRAPRPSNISKRTGAPGKTSND